MKDEKNRCKKNELTGPKPASTRTIIEKATRTNTSQERPISDIGDKWIKSESATSLTIYLLRKFHSQQSSWCQLITCRHSLFRELSVEEEFIAAAPGIRIENHLSATAASHISAPFYYAYTLCEISEPILQATLEDPAQRTVVLQRRS